MTLRERWRCRDATDLREPMSVMMTVEIMEFDVAQRDRSRLEFVDSLFRTGSTFIALVK